ncbi:hypothetical protein [Flavobacterium sp.]|uniref:hypothetical protein n=1 Tax=Flavobacterium sp. TaxID=239 RepID=UPI0037523EE3
MKKIITLLLICSFTISNVYSNPVKVEHPKESSIIIINGKLYKQKNGVLFPLVGIVLKWIAPIIIGEIKERAINFVKDLFTEKDIKVLDESEGERDDVEVITINGQDTDQDGNYEFSSGSEDHNNDGEEDNETEFTEYESYENGLEQLVNNQLEYIDQYYQGDVDGDGTEE